MDSVTVPAGSIAGASFAGLVVDSVSEAGVAPGTFSKYQAATRPSLPLGALDAYPLIDGADLGRASRFEDDQQRACWRGT